MTDVLPTPAFARRPASFDGFVHAQDARLVDGSGRELLLRGVGLALLNQQLAVNPSLQMAGASVMVVPILIVFIIFQRYVIQGFALSGLK